MILLQVELKYWQAHLRRSYEQAGDPSCQSRLKFFGHFRPWACHCHLRLIIYTVNRKIIYTVNRKNGLCNLCIPSKPRLCKISQSFCNLSRGGPIPLDLNSSPPNLRQNVPNINGNTPGCWHQGGALEIHFLIGISTLPTWAPPGKNEWSKNAEIYQIKD